MATDKFRCRFHHNVGSPLDGTAKNRGSGRVVDHQRHTLLVRDAGQFLNVGDVELGVTQGLSVYSPRFLVNGRPQAVKVVSIDKAYIDAQARQGVVEEVVGAAIEGSGGDDLVSGAGQRRNGQRFSGLAGGGGQGGCSPFAGGAGLVENVGGWVD